jgi:hypothetical protein
VAEDATVARTCEPIEALPTCARSLALRVLGGPPRASTMVKPFTPKLSNLQVCVEGNQMWRGMTRRLHTDSNPSHQNSHPSVQNLSTLE